MIKHFIKSFKSFKLFKLFALTTVFLFSSLSLASDFTTGLVTGVVLAGGSSENEEYYFPTAENLVIQSKFNSTMKTHNLENDFIRIKKGILEQAEKNKNFYCHSTGMFDTSSNNWLELEKQGKKQYTVLFNFFIQRGYKITPLEKGGNGFCVKW